VTGLQRHDLLLERRTITDAEAAHFEALLRRREQREPLQHIVRGTGFYGLDLLAGPQALIPRPETERLVELALQQLQHRRRPAVLDIGTGSGAIALAISSERRDATVTASDVSPAALQLARKNAQQLGLAVTLIESDLLLAPAAAQAARKSDLLVSNPPYLPAADRHAVQPEVAFDPPLALYAGEDGLDVYRRLQQQAFALLRPGAQLLLELDPRNVRQAQAEADSWAAADVLADLADRERYLLLER
jgi:release factor glutamine methyltransferase